jgi:predicted N-formylglutamate amidohydrolase
VLLGIHSFTPVLNGRPRPWPIGISSWGGREFAELLIGALRRNTEIVVGDDQPYPIEEAIDCTIPRHSAGRGLSCAMIEIRQDGLGTAAGVALWAARLAEAYRLIEADAMLLRGSPPAAD